jgi:hypothetical protein
MLCRLCPVGLGLSLCLVLQLVEMLLSRFEYLYIFVYLSLSYLNCFLQYIDGAVGVPRSQACLLCFPGAATVFCIPLLSILSCYISFVLRFPVWRRGQRKVSQEGHVIILKPFRLKS